MLKINDFICYKQNSLKYVNCDYEIYDYILCPFAEYYASRCPALFYNVDKELDKVYDNFLCFKRIETYDDDFFENIEDMYFYMFCNTQIKYYNGIKYDEYIKNTETKNKEENVEKYREYFEFVDYKEHQYCELVKREGSLKIK